MFINRFSFANEENLGDPWISNLVALLKVSMAKPYLNRVIIILKI